MLAQIEQRLRPDIVIFYNVDVQLLESTAYYGTYSNVSRGKRKNEKPKREEAVSWKPEVIEDPPPTISKELKKRWSHFIQKVYETDPLICLKWALALPLRQPTPGRHIFSNN